MQIVDAHLDLSYNALRGRAVTRSAREQPADRLGTPAVGLPDLRQAGVALVLGTIWCSPARRAGQPSPPSQEPRYRTAEEAAAMAERHVQWYRRQFEAGEMRLVKDRSGVESASAGADHAVAMIQLMEGADPILGPEDVPRWYDVGVRAVGLAWQQTRYAGGTGAPGPLTAEGRALVPALDRAGIIHDTSHLAEQSFWDLLELARGPVMASHSNCRAIVPGDRQLSDEMIRVLAGRGGVVGVVLYDRFLLPPEVYGRRRATLEDLVVHVKHMSDLLGDARHIGIGSDMDGGFGRENVPAGIETSADLPRVAEALSAGGFGDEDVRAIMAGNWLDFFRRSLPAFG